MVALLVTLPKSMGCLIQMTTWGLPPQVILWNASQVLWDLHAKQVSLFQARIDLSRFETIVGCPGTATWIAGGCPGAAQGAISWKPFWDNWGCPGWHLVLPH
jgi:hypothetical protein